VNKDLKSSGDSSKMAQRRFFNLEKRFTNNSSLHLEYNRFVNEYIELGHMVEVDSEPDISNISVY